MKLRFAQAPGALLHIGQARLALANYLVARRHEGAVLLRVDDADAGRVRPGIDDAIQHDLRWLGLDWDQCIRQSARLERYSEAADKLKAAGRLYPCFESDEELTFKRELRQRQGKAAIYDRAMLKMTAAQRAKAEAGGKRPYWRFLLSGVAAEWGDMVLGRQSIKLSAISDPILIRADGTPLPVFAAAVDDAELGITHVISDADQVTATGIQLDIRAALGARAGTIRFGHLPPLDAGGKFSKLPTLRNLRNDGIEPAALVGTLAALGTPDPPRPEPAPLLAAHYDLTRIDSAKPPRFDPEQLLAANRAVLRSMPFEAVQDRLPPAATPAFWHAIRGSIDLLREARGWWEVVGGTIVPPVVEGEAGFFAAALERLPAEPWDGSTWQHWITALGQSSSNGAAVLQLALTGEEHGPDLADLLPLIGRARVVERLRGAAA